MTQPVRAVVTHSFPFPAERVFDAWLDVDLLGRWMFGPAVREEHIVRLGPAPRTPRPRGAGPIAIYIQFVPPRIDLVASQ